MSVVPASPTAASDQDGLLQYFQQLDSPVWADDASRFRMMMQSDGSARFPVSACPTMSIPEQFAKGFASFPQGWVGGMLQAAMMWGAFGDTQKHHAEIRNQQLSAILYFAKQDLKTTFRVVRWLAINVLPKDWAFVAGRLAGGAFTMRATGLAKLPKWGRLAAAGSSLVLASYGSAILAIAKGDYQLTSILNAIATGRYDGAICIPEGQLRNELRSLNDKYGEDIAPAMQLIDRVQALIQSLGAM
jgi:hypothetical protein